MSDSINLIDRARARRAACMAELERLDEFIELAEALERGEHPPLRRAMSSGDDAVDWRNVHLMGSYRNALDGE